MDLLLRIPDDLAPRLDAKGDLAHRALEALAFDLFRAGDLSEPELRRLLGPRDADPSDALADLTQERQELSGPPLRLVAGAGPLGELVLVGAVDSLPTLFRKVMLPVTVRLALRDPQAPDAVQAWVNDLPPWIEARPDSSAAASDPALQPLDPGDRATIGLARALRADAILTGDRAAARLARQRGLAAVGTLGVLDLAARRGLIDLPETIARLRIVTSRYRPELLEAVLNQPRD